ncbi:MAG: RNA polymerase sigma factor RpoD/SigA [Alphaproteobacteria bacterium]|nr:RNA polymerase sigma factor RpoD/SigA [Alphaproteobacteria bacterium]
MTTEEYRDAVHALVTEALIQFGITEDQKLRDLYIVLGCTPREAQNNVVKIRNKKVLSGTEHRPKLAHHINLLAATIGLPERPGISTTASRYRLTDYSNMSNTLRKRLGTHNIHTFADLCHLFFDQGLGIVESAGHAVKITQNILNIETGQGIIATKAWTQLQKYFANNGENSEPQPLLDSVNQSRPASEEQQHASITPGFSDKLAALAALTIQTPKPTEAVEVKSVLAPKEEKPTVHRILTKRETFGPKIRFPASPTHMKAPPLLIGGLTAFLLEHDEGVPLSKVAKLPKDLLERMARCGLQSENQLYDLLKITLKNQANASKYKKKILDGDLLIRNTMDFNVAGDFLMSYLEQQEERMEKANATALNEHQLRWEASCQIYQTVEVVDTITFRTRRKREDSMDVITVGKDLCGDPIRHPSTPPILIPTQQVPFVDEEGSYISSNQPLPFNQAATPDAPIGTKADIKKNGKRTKLPRQDDGSDFDVEERDQPQKRHRRERLSFDAPTGTNTSYKRDICEPDGFSEREQKEKPPNGPRGPSSEELLSREIRGHALLTHAKEQKIFHEILDEQHGILSIALSLPEAYEELTHFYGRKNASSMYIYRPQKQEFAHLTDAEQEDLSGDSLTTLQHIRTLFDQHTLHNTSPSSTEDYNPLPDLTSSIMDLFPAHGFWMELRKKLGSQNQDGKITDKLTIWDTHVQEIKKREDEIMKSNMRLVFSTVNKHYLAFSNLRADLVSEGNIGMTRATRMFNPYLGTKFSTYATWWVRQSVNRCATNTYQDVRLPTHIHDQLVTLNKTTADLKKKLRRDPTDEETADKLGLTIDDLRKLSSYRQNQFSLDADVNGKTTPDDGEQNPLIQFFAGVSESPEDHCIQQSTGIVVREVISTLTPREKKIIQMRYGIDEQGEHTLEQIGEAFSVSRERVRQIEKQALTKLHRGKRREALTPFANFIKPQP